MLLLVKFFILGVFLDKVHLQLSSVSLKSWTCMSDQNHVSIQTENASILLGGLFALHQPGEDGVGCGVPSGESIQAFEAARWTINHMNANNYVPKMKIGLEAFDTCSLSGNAVSAVQSFYPHVTNFNDSCEIQTGIFKLGFIGQMQGSVSEAVAKMAVHIPASIIAQQSGLMSLSNKQIYPTFMRTHPSSAIFAKTIVKLLQWMQLEDIAVVYMDSIAAIDGYLSILEAAHASGICVSISIKISSFKDPLTHHFSHLVTSGITAAVFYGDSNDAYGFLKALQRKKDIIEFQSIKWFFSELELDRDYSSLHFAQGAFVVMPSTIEIGDFQEYFTRLSVSQPDPENPWLWDWYMNKYKCNLGVSVRFSQSCSGKYSTNPRLNDFIQSPYVQQTIFAIIAYVEAYKEACHASNGSVYSCFHGMDVMEFHNHFLRNVDFILPTNFTMLELRGHRIAFDANGDFIWTDFAFYNYTNNTFEKFGSLTAGDLTFSTPPAYHSFSFSNLSITSKCAADGCGECVRGNFQFNMQYKPGDIVLLVLFSSGSGSDNLLDCGTTLPDNLINAVAVTYGVNHAHKLNASELEMGYLVVDVCPGAKTAEDFLSSFFGGHQRFTDATNYIIPTTNIDVIIDMTPEDTPHGLATLISSLEIAHIRVASSGRSLLHNYAFLYLTSLLPSQDAVLLAVLKLLTSLDWRYVQVISAASGRHYRAALSFRSQARANGICVALWSTFKPHLIDVVDHMTSMQNASVVVVFASYSQFASMLDAVRMLKSSSRYHQQLTFVSGSEEFGISDNVVGSFTAELEGFITMQLSEILHAGFDTWLSELSHREIGTDIFLSKWYENKHHCSLSASSGNSFSNCQHNANIVPNETYQAYAPYIIHAVDTISMAYVAMSKEGCFGSGMCYQYHNRKDRSSYIVNFMEDVNFGTEFQIASREGKSDLSFYNYRSGTFINIGHFKMDHYHIDDSNIVEASSVSTASGQPATALNVQCVGECRQCLYLRQSQAVYHLPGDWMIGALFGIRSSESVNQNLHACGSVQLDGPGGFLYSAAMMFALDQLNRGLAPVHLRNVSLGAIIMDHCNVAQRAFTQIVDIYTGPLEEGNVTPMMADEGFYTSPYLGWLTDNTASSADIFEFLKPLGVSIVSPSATSVSLSDSPTFFRTVLGDTAISRAIMKLCKSLEFFNIQVVYEDSNYGIDGYKAILHAAEQDGICVVNSIKVNGTSDISLAVHHSATASTKVVITYLGTASTGAFLTEAAKLMAGERLTIILPESFDNVHDVANGDILHGLLSLKIQSPRIKAFEDFLCDLDVHNYRRDCINKSLTSAVSFSHSSFVLPTINAVYSLAQALHLTLVEICGESYSKVCPSFTGSGWSYRLFVEKLKLVQFTYPSSNTFQFSQREGNAVYDVLSFNGSAYETIGTYGEGSIHLTDRALLMLTYHHVPSSCGSSCSDCAFTAMPFSFTDGDIYLAGLFDVHTKGHDVFDCGSINSRHGFQLLEAFHFALEQVNSKNGIFSDVLSGVRLGGLGFDVCQSKIKGGQLASNIHNGLTTLIWNGKEINQSKIDAYIGTYSSSSSIYLSHILADLKIPQISFGSTSSRLKNRNAFPFLFRTVPSIDKQILGILKYLVANNLHYVQLLYSSNLYGLEAVDDFKGLSSQFSICVAQQVAFSQQELVSDESSDDVVISLLQKPTANTVVIFATTVQVRSFLQAVSRNSLAMVTLKFIGTDQWSEHELVAGNIKGAAEDSIFFVHDFHGSVKGFLHEYLWRRNPTNAMNNPWFEEWFQHVLECYTSPSSMTSYSKQCDPNASLKTRVIEDAEVLHVMNAVYSAAFAIHQTLRQMCGVNYAALCSAYHTYVDRGTHIRDNLDHVRFTDPTGKIFSFVDREGNTGYQIFKLVSSPVKDEFVYSQFKVGDVSSDGDLRLVSGMSPIYDGSCSRQSACVECPSIRRHCVHHAVGGNVNASMTVVGLFDIHERGDNVNQCGKLNIEGFYKFLAFFWVHSQMSTAHSDVRLLAIDTCSGSLHAGHDLYGMLKDGTICNADPLHLANFDMDNIGTVVVTGTDNTASAARVLEPLMLTYLSDDESLPMFEKLRYLLHINNTTISPSTMLAKFLMHNDWTFIGVIYLDSGKYMQEYNTFHELAVKNNLCLHSKLALSESSSTTDVRDMFLKIDLDLGSKIFLLFAPIEVIQKIFRVALKIDVSYDFLWILPLDYPHLDNFNFFKSLSIGASPRAIIVRPVIPIWEDYVQYVNDVVSDVNNGSNKATDIPLVWLRDFYQTLHSCHINDQKYPMNIDVECSSNLSLFNDVVTMSRMVHHTIISSYISMIGLHKFYNNCQRGQSIQNCLLQVEKTRQFIRDAIIDGEYNVSAQIYQVLNSDIHAIKNYNFYLLTVRDGSVHEEVYATYLGDDDNFVDHNNNLNVKSQCNKSDRCGCQMNSAMQKYVDMTVVPLSPRNYYSNGLMMKYYWPVWAVIVATLSGLGLLVSIFLFMYLAVAYPVKMGTSILGYFTIVGIMGIYATNFAFVLHATSHTCAVRRFCSGVVYSIVFASLLVKVIDNWRFTDADYFKHPYRGLTNSWTLLFITVGVVLIQCLIPTQWLLLVHPAATNMAAGVDVTKQHHDYWWCSPTYSYDLGLVLSFSFVIFILLLTSIFSAISWDLDRNNYESQWTFASVIVTAGCFLVWMIISTNADPVYRDPTVAIGNCFNATALLIMLPLRKLKLMCSAKKERLHIYSSPYDHCTNVFSNSSYREDNGDHYIIEDTVQTKEDLFTN